MTIHVQHPHHNQAEVSQFQLVNHLATVGNHHDDYNMINNMHHHNQNGQQHMLSNHGRCSASGLAYHQVIYPT